MVADGLDLRQPPIPAPFAVSYRVEQGTTTVSSWPLAVGQALPIIPLHLDGDREVLIDLEHTYREAARRVYLT